MSNNQTSPTLHAEGNSAVATTQANLEVTEDHAQVFPRLPVIRIDVDDLQESRFRRGQPPARPLRLGKLGIDRGLAKRADR